MTNSEERECFGCGSTEHVMKECPFNSPPTPEVLGVLTGQVPVRSAPIAMSPQENPSDDDSTGPDR